MDCGVVSLPLLGSVSFAADRPSRGIGQLASGEFLFGSENRTAELAVRAVLQSSNPEKYAPLLIYGPSGSGKTHLAEGIAAAWRQRCSGRPRVYVLTAEEFARQWHEAIAAQATNDFRQKYRGASALLIENIPQLSGRAAAQEELLYTLDELLAASRLVIATALVPPSRWPDILPELRSRLQQGLLIPLRWPGAAVRKTLLQRWAEAMPADIRPEALGVLAERLELSVPRLLGTLIQLVEIAALRGAALTERVVLEYLDRLGATGFDLKRIAAAAARQFGVSLRQMRGKSRRRAVVLARDTVIYIARESGGLSLPELGRYFGNRDHTTISHGYYKLKSLLQSDPAVRQAVENVQNMLKEC